MIQIKVILNRDEQTSESHRGAAIIQVIKTTNHKEIIIILSLGLSRMEISRHLKSRVLAITYNFFLIWNPVFQ